MTRAVQDWRIRFASKFERGEPDECWNWKGHIGTRGYGMFGMGSRTKREPSNRAAYIFHCGEVPEGMHVLHSCDNKKCVNPRHLHLGSTIDNSREAAERGLYLSGESWRSAHVAALPKGEGHANAKLTEQKILQIRASSKTCADLGRQYGVNKLTVSRIKRRLSWAHVGVAE